MKELTDLEITKLCAEAIGISGHPVREGMEMWSPEGWERNKDALVVSAGKHLIWNPLHDDAQAMALVKAFRIWISASQCSEGVLWGAANSGARKLRADALDLNRAICECVAKMQLAKQKVAA